MGFRINIHCALILHRRYVNLSELMINSKTIHDFARASDPHPLHASLASVLKFHKRADCMTVHRLLKLEWTKLPNLTFKLCQFKSVRGLFMWVFI